MVVSIALTSNVLKRYFYCQMFFYINTSVSKHPKGMRISFDRHGSNIFLPLRGTNTLF